MADVIPTVSGVAAMLVYGEVAVLYGVVDSHCVCFL